jgi:hypothetical protein
LRRFLPWLPLPTPPPPKPPKNRQNLPVDGRLPLWHHCPTVNAAKNKFSLTRAASITGTAAKSKFLSVSVYDDETVQPLSPALPALPGALGGIAT